MKVSADALLCCELNFKRTVPLICQSNPRMSIDIPSQLLCHIRQSTRSKPKVYAVLDTDVWNTKLIWLKAFPMSKGSAKENR